MNHHVFTCLRLLSVFSVAIFFALPSYAADKEANKTATDEKKQIEPAVSQAALAAELALRGEKRQSPILLLAAAELLGGVKESPRDASEVVIQQDESSAQKRTQLSSKSEPLVQSALEYAKGDEELLSFLKGRIEQLSSRGLVVSQGKDLPSVVIKGTTFKVLLKGKLLPGKFIELGNVIFEGKEPAIVLVAGDGDGDLDTWVYDANTGGEIGKDTDNTSTCLIQWVTRFEGPFKIRVRNVGQQWENYVVLANW